MASISERENREIEAANASGNTPVVFIHGLWLLPSSWANWADVFKQAGYAPLTPDWPDDPETVEQARANPDVLAKKTLQQVADHTTEIITALDKKPALIGHSTGGLLAQMLAGRGLSAATVAIDPGVFRGVLPLPASVLKGVGPFLVNPLTRGRAITLTFDQFTYGWANALDEKEAKELYDTFHVAGSGIALVQMGDANLNPWTEAKVDTTNPDRGPLLIMDGEKDHTVPWAIANAAYKRQRRNPAVTEIVKMPNRGHSLTIDHGWREVAQTALDFVKRFADALEPLIDQKLKDNAIPGAVVLIDKGGEGRWVQSFGTARLGSEVPIGPEDYFRVGSNTKTMTATVVLQLVQERKLALDDPVAKYYPDVPNGDTITIAQLLEMRSGLANYTYDPAFVQQPQKAWTPEELLALSFAKPVAFAPGAEFEYSNANYILLGVIIEKVTGMAAPDVFQQRIFEPLGLTHTSLPGLSDHTIPSAHPSGYMFLTDNATLDNIELTPEQQAAAFAGTLKPDDVTDWNPSPGWTAGSAISTAEDMAVYTKKLVTGGLLDDNTQQLRLDSIKPVDPTKPNGSGYGLGLARIAPNLIGHDGQIPGYTTLAVYDPHIDLLVVILTNLYETPAQKLPVAPLLSPIIDRFYGRSGDIPTTSDAAPATS